MQSDSSQTLVGVFSMIYRFTAFSLCVGLIVSAVVADQESPPPTQGTIQVPIKNLQNVGRGQLIVLLFQRMKRVEPKISRAYKSQILSVSGKSMTVNFKNIPFGEYAVAVLHDMDKDRKLDTNFLGIPREDLGCSNNAKGGPLGPPAWAKARFRHDKATSPLTPLKMWRVYD
jgi:uncharacterized protein (DUF2141 family)